MGDRYRSACPAAATGQMATKKKEFASPSPTTAAEFLAQISARSSSPSTPQKKTPVQVWGCGYQKASSKSTEDPFESVAGPRALQPERYFLSSYPAAKKSARSRKHPVPHFPLAHNNLQPMPAQ